MLSTAAADMSSNSSSSRGGAARSRAADDREEGEVSGSRDHSRVPSASGHHQSAATHDVDDRQRGGQSGWDQLPPGLTRAQQEERRRALEAEGLVPAPSEQQRREQERVEVKQ